MQSISVFNLTGTLQNDLIANRNSNIEQEVNGVNERLNFELFVNETIDGYKRCRVLLDEVIKLRARVLNTEIEEVIVNNAYEIFIHETRGTLIMLANKKSSETIREFIEKTFELEFNKKIFDLDTIIQESSNVKRAQFKNLLIETINGSSLSGNRVTDTDMYDLMLNSGELSTIAVVYPFNNTEVKFSISTSGSIVLFSTVAAEDILEWLDLLLV